MARAPQWPVGQCGSRRRRGPKGKRALSMPHDPRLSIWTTQCLEALVAALGDQADAVTLDAEIITDTFEALQAAERTLPG